MPPETGLIGSWSEAALPPPALTVSQWAEAKRFLPETSAARGARWRNEATPYLVGPMDAVHELGVRYIALRKGSQLGGSEALHNIIGYFIEYDPCPMLFVHPSAGVAEEWSKDRLADMLRSTPVLRELVREGRASRGSMEAESTLSLKMFPNGYLALGGANTPNTFARRSVRVAMGDDVDRFPPVLADEGDPAELLKNRVETYDDGLVIFVSTPTLKGGRIDTLVSRSDQRQYHLECPECGRLDYVTWGDRKHFSVAYDDRNPDTARLECASLEHGGCGARLSETDRRQLIREAGAREGSGWIATAEPKERGLVGFHLPSMLSTLGSVSLAGLVEHWLGARAKGRDSLRVFVNTKLAEGWEEKGARVEGHALLNRREFYGDGVEVPAQAVALTAGVDVQDNRFEVQIVAWGPNAEKWVVDYRIVPGDPKKVETRAKLLEALNRKYRHASGHQLPIHAVCVDTGYATEEMYDFVLRHEVRRFFATKGFGGRSGEPIVGKPSEKTYGRSPRPVRLYPINVDDAKKDVLDSLALEYHAGPGVTHFPLDADLIHEEYFAQLTAEHRETRYSKGGVATHMVWVVDRERNEALDTMVLCLAAYRLLNPNVHQLLEALAAAPLPDATAPTEAERPAARVRQSAESPYLR